jgi:hypothetical protein
MANFRLIRLPIPKQSIGVAIHWRQRMQFGKQCFSFLPMFERFPLHQLLYSAHWYGAWLKFVFIFIFNPSVCFIHLCVWVLERSVLCIQVIMTLLILLVIRRTLKRNCGGWKSWCSRNLPNPEILTIETLLHSANFQNGCLLL